MIKPVRFNFNAETAVNNSFQQASGDDAVAEKATAEFEQFVTVLTNAGIDVTVVNDTAEPHTPDSVFPNNWISFHQDGSIFLYPMFAVNRRLERKPHVLEAISQKFQVNNTVDLTGYEAQQLFLEGTGSMVLDRTHKIAYACLSPRTAPEVLKDWASKSGYTVVSFVSVDSNGSPIYHTNVMMCVADRYAVICLDSVPDPTERENIIQHLSGSGKEIISISFDQMNRFAGNMLQVQNKDGQHFLVMSSQAFNSLNKEQVAAIELYNPILHSDIKTIETNGGGSARCMMAEVFLPKK
ncbi:MAG TPA: amidinotransferase [Chitinophagaceae bacterium]|nr:amidinotransferase [Chitinophagaceae bacterium]